MNDTVIDDLKRAAGRYVVVHQETSWYDIFDRETETCPHMALTTPDKARDHAAALNLAGELRRMAEDKQLCLDVARFGLRACLMDLVAELEGDVPEEQQWAAST